MISLKLLRAPKRVEIPTGFDAHVFGTRLMLPDEPPMHAAGAAVANTGEMMLAVVYRQNGANTVVLVGPYTAEELEDVATANAAHELFAECLRNSLVALKTGEVPPDTNVEVQDICTDPNCGCRNARPPRKYDEFKLPRPARVTLPGCIAEVEGDTLRLDRSGTAEYTLIVRNWEIYLGLKPAGAASSIASLLGPWTPAEMREVIEALCAAGDGREERKREMLGFLAEAVDRIDAHKQDGFRSKAAEN